MGTLSGMAFSSFCCLSGEASSQGLSSGGRLERSCWLPPLLYVSCLHASNLEQKAFRREPPPSIALRRLLQSAPPVPGQRGGLGIPAGCLAQGPPAQRRSFSWEKYHPKLSLSATRQFTQLNFVLKYSLSNSIALFFYFFSWMQFFISCEIKSFP